MTPGKPETTTRPWGHFKLFAENQPCSVKVVSIEPAQSLSLQYHSDRSQQYIIINTMILEWSTEPVPEHIMGSAEVIRWYTNHRQHRTVYPGDEVYFDRRVIHRASNCEDDVASFVEVAYGHNREDDIVRLEDKYGRDKI
jgi:mannose-6-phosphate isomerase-like protein (cupin superfamily)